LPTRAAETHSPYEPSFAQVYALLEGMARKVDDQRAEARGLFAELVRLPPQQRRLLLGNSRRFASWALAELLLDEASRAAAADPAETEELAACALEVLRRLLPEHLDETLRRDLEARAWGLRATALGRSDPAAARAAFAEAERLLALGTGDPLERARLLDLGAALGMPAGELRANEPSASAAAHTRS
jgi:hypothetical protein